MSTSNSNARQLFLQPRMRPNTWLPPETISQAERVRVQGVVNQLSRWMDSQFELPILRWRFGLDALIGLVPFIGDAATTLVSLYILTLASQCGVPRITLARMGMNVAIDMLLGSLPLLGDVFDLWWKANQKNAQLLQIHLSETSRESLRARSMDWLFVGGVLACLVALFAGIVASVAYVASLLWATIGSLVV